MCSSTERTRSPRSAHPPVLLLLDGEAIDAARYIERDLTGDTHSGSKAISLASCSHDRRDEVRRANGDRSSIVCWTAGTPWRERALHSSGDQHREHPVMARLTGGPSLLRTQPQGRLVEAASFVGG